MSDPLDTFRTEAAEHLAALELALLEMEQQPDEAEPIATAFRAMHTIKGAGGMFGFQALSEFTHHLESAFDQVRNGIIQVSPDLISIMLDAKDLIEAMLLDPEQTPEQAQDADELLQRLRQVVPAVADSGEAAARPAAGQTPKGEESAYRIRIVPAPSAFTDGFDVLPILNELHGLGTCHVATHSGEVPALAELDAEVCRLSWDIVLLTEQAIDAIQDTFIFVADDWQVRVEAIDLAQDNDYSDQLGDILVERGVVTPDQVSAVLTAKPRMGELLHQAGLVSESDINAALLEQKVIRETKQRKAQGMQEDIVRVPASRLDALMDLVGELVIVQARMKQLAQSRDDEDMQAVSEDLDRLTTELRDNTFSVRMLPIGTTFSRFRRLVRDLSRDLGKEIRLETEGAETELDKMVIDRLADPLVHLIRNSIDHGIEPPQQRQADGKPRIGSIRLSAEHAESHVVIRIIDDGAGLDTQRIRAKAQERGLIGGDFRLTDDEIQQLIFEPGFSTAEKVTDVSGRGVGMDVVKRSIHDLGGNVSIHSTLGTGTTIKIVLPLTLAIIEGLMVAVSDERYVLPLTSIEECVELSRDAMSEQNGKRLVTLRGSLVPYLRLRDWFRVPGEGPAIEQIVITRLGDGYFGFSVDEVIGQYQTVIKRLGKLYEGVAGLAGATILGDGGVAMILDAAGLVEALETELRA